ncbi:hypothetical protein N7462_008880 [Penicillium macrosclerotiorum]|uniref:uncharacterized protein n=1 Tax=Penicillium macrosclerotiorum TaxID=303699 RepID=UPI002548113B|nr:uncharacterized protein N7462_008880 [Penicillium macrosclerotiorum]KAJ5675983.1 hypothetical protein N7462_008880 [Penicillium macrosclerotiorum]
MDISETNFRSLQPAAVNIKSLGAISGVLERLNQLGAAIRRSSVSSQTSKARAFAATLDLTSFEQVANLLLRTLYLNASDSLIERLTQSMADSYARFLQRKSRQERLQVTRPVPRSQIPLTPIQEEPSGAFAGSDAMRVSLKRLRIGDSLTDNIPRLPPPPSDNRVPQSEPTSVDSRKVKDQLRRSISPTSNTKSVSILVNQAEYPHPAKESLVCEWCFSPLMAGSRETPKWQYDLLIIRKPHCHLHLIYREHINEDFEPYICLSEECAEYMPRFASSRQWLEHMVTAHGENWHQEVYAPASWICPLCAELEASFNSPEDLSAHIDNLHIEISREQQIKAIVRQSMLQCPRPLGTCPLCCFTIIDEQVPQESQRGTTRSNEQAKHYMANSDESRSKRLKTDTSFSKMSGETKPDIEQKIIPGKKSEVTDDSVSKSKLGTEVIGSHVAAHLQNIMLLTLRLISIDGIAETSTGSDFGSPRTDYQASWVDSGARGLDQEESDIGYDLSQHTDGNIDLDDGAQSYIDWSDVPHCDETPMEEDKILQEIGLSRAGRPNNREDQSQAHYIIPSLENRHFTGRQSTLDVLKQKLFIQANSEKLALCGLGGIGKTQVALQLAGWVKTHIPDCSVFWAPAFSLESFEQGCSQIANELQIYPSLDGENPMEIVHRHLSSDRSGRWLFIVDNADDIELLVNELNQYLPANKRGVTLLTTQSREVAVSFAERDIVELEMMTIEEGATFLTKVIRESSFGTQESALQLLEELNFIPLAIMQAANYINLSHITTTQYLDLMHKTEQDRVRLASRNFHDSSRYYTMQNAVTTIWHILFNRIKSSEPSAADLLGFIAYLEPKAIPRSILPALNSEKDIELGICILCDYGLLTKMGTAEDMFDMHSLVQLSVRAWIKEMQKTQQIIASVIKHVDQCFPSDQYKNRAIWSTYLPHAIAVTRREESKSITERYSLLSKIGKCMLVEGRAAEALRYFEDVFVWMKITYKEEDPSRLSSQHELAQAYQANGQIKQAIELFEDVFMIRLRTLNEEHPDRLASQHELAQAYQANGQIKEAIKLLENIVTLRERTLNEEHPDRLASQHELAQACQANGQIKEAIKLLENIVTLRERTLNEEHPDRLASQREFAQACQANGQIKEAIKLLENIVTLRERTLNEEHPDRLASQRELAQAYQANGQIKEAIKLLENIVTLRERTLNEEHPDRLASQRELAQAYQANGQIKEAIELLENVVTLRERTLNEEHPDRLASQRELAQAYQANGQIKEAIELLENVVALRERTLNKGHPALLASQRALQEANQSVKALP